MKLDKLEHAENSIGHLRPLDMIVAVETLPVCQHTTHTHTHTHTTHTHTHTHTPTLRPISVLIRGVPLNNTVSIQPMYLSYAAYYSRGNGSWCMQASVTEDHYLFNQP